MYPSFLVISRKKQSCKCNNCSKLTIHNLNNVNKLTLVFLISQSSRLTLNVLCDLGRNSCTTVVPLKDIAHKHGLQFRVEF